MPSYNKKDKVTLAYDANKKRLRAEGSIILMHIMNDAISEMDTQFAEALNRGEILNIGGTVAEMKEYLRRAAEKELGTGKEPARALLKR